MSRIASGYFGLLLTAASLLVTPVHANAPTSLKPLVSVDASHWRGTLDLREMPAFSAPGSIETNILVPQDARGLIEATVSVNGYVIDRKTIDAGHINTLRSEIEPRLLSTVSRIEISVQRQGADCVSQRCPVVGASLTEPIRLTLGDVPADPQSFSDFVTRFRAGVVVQTERPAHAGLAVLAKAAIASRAPIDAGARARLVVGPTPPAASQPALRFDNGPVRLVTRDGRTVLSATELAALTVVQIIQVNGAPVLWIRPGSGAAPPTMDLDYGNVAAFDGSGRVVAFNPVSDTAIRIEYASDLAGRTILPPWRISIIAAWLALTLGFAIVIRRIPPLRAECAQ